MLIETGVLTVAFGVAAARSVYVLQPGISAVKMFLGKVRGFENTPGLHLKKPWEKAIKLDTKQKFKDLVLENVKTEDGYFVTLPIQLQYRVTDPGKFLFNANDPEHQMYSQIENVVRSQAAQMKFDVLYTSKDALETAIEAHERTEVEQKFGVTLDRAIPGDPKPSDAVLAAINEGIRLKETAKGNRDAALLEGEGIAGKRAKIFEKYPEQIKALTADGMPSENAEALVAISMMTDTIREAAIHGNTILATTDAGSLMQQYTGIAKKFSAQPGTKPDTTFSSPNP